MGIKIGKMAGCKFMTIIVFNIIPTFSNQQNINPILQAINYNLIFCRNKYLTITCQDAAPTDRTTGNFVSYSGNHVYLPFVWSY